MELVAPAWNHCSLVIVVDRRIKPEVLSVVGESSYCGHQDDILTPGQLTRTERSADGREGLAHCIHGGITLCNKAVYRTALYLSLFTIRVNTTGSDDHVFCCEAIMGCPVLATWSWKNSYHLGPGRRLRDSRHLQGWIQQFV